MLLVVFSACSPFANSESSGELANLKRLAFGTALELEAGLVAL